MRVGRLTTFVITDSNNNKKFFREKRLSNFVDNLDNQIFEGSLGKSSKRAVPLTHRIFTASPALLLTFGVNMRRSQDNQAPVKGPAQNSGSRPTRAKV